MTRPIPTCASCEKFPVAALEADGAGTCSIYERPAKWNDSAAGCPLHDRAQDHKLRFNLVKLLFQQQPKEQQQ